MVRCQGCGVRMRSPKAKNWKLFRECYPCAKKDHPEFYKDKKNHGTGGTYMKPPECRPMIVEPIKNTF